MRIKIVKNKLSAYKNNQSNITILRRYSLDESIVFAIINILRIFKGK